MLNKTQSISTKKIPPITPNEMILSGKGLYPLPTDCEFDLHNYPGITWQYKEDK